MEMFPSMTTIPETPKDDSLGSSVPPVEDEVQAGASAGGIPERARSGEDPGTDGRTAEERLLETISEDPRGSDAEDVTAVDDVFPVERIPAPASEPVPQEPAGSESAAEADQVPEPWDEPAGADVEPVPVPADDSRVDDQTLERELQAARDALDHVTADRDDLSERLERAAAEFDKLHESLAEAGRAREALQVELSQANDSLAAARSALDEAQGQAAQARQAREAAQAQAAETERRRQREVADLQNNVTRLGAACEAAHRGWRRGIAAGTLLVLAAAVAGFGLGRAERSRIARDATAIRPPPVEPVATSPATPPAVARPVPPPPPVPLAWPVIRDERFTVRETSDALFIGFAEPLFARGTELTPAGRQDLRRLAVLLKPYAAQYRFEVEGHTDASPVASRQSYSSNHELGLARARAALDVLGREAAFPAGVASISSAGDASPLVPGDTAEARRKNRTVIVILHQAKPVSP